MPIGSIAVVDEAGASTLDQHHPKPLTRIALGRHSSFPVRQESYPCAALSRESVMSDPSGGEEDGP